MRIDLISSSESAERWRGDRRCLAAVTRSVGRPRTGLLWVVAVLLSPLGLEGCSGPWLRPYRIEIQQGNFIDRETLRQVKPGMTKDQVRGILGTPLINDVFHVDRWDYVFTRTPSNSTTREESRASLYFDGEVLKRIEADLMPARPEPGKGN